MAQPVPVASSDEVADAMRQLGLRNADRCGACGVAASMLGSTCRYCRSRFCLKHAQAETHGCGADAAKAERAAWLKGAREGPPPAKPSDVQTKVSKQKLAAKLDTASLARKPGAAPGRGRGGGGAGRGGGRT